MKEKYGLLRRNECMQWQQNDQQGQCGGSKSGRDTHFDDIETSDMK